MWPNKFWIFQDGAEYHHNSSTYTFMLMWSFVKENNLCKTTANFLSKVGKHLKRFPILEIDWKYHGFWHARTGGKKRAVFRAKITQSCDKLWNHYWTQCLGHIVFADVVCLHPICFCKPDLSYLGWLPISKRCSILISCQKLVQRQTASKRTIMTYMSFLFTPHDSGKNLFITWVVVCYDVPQSALLLYFFDLRHLVIFTKSDNYVNAVDMVN